MSKECDICGRQSLENERLCEYHHRAKKSLDDGFSSWRRAYGIEWQEYLEKLLDEENLGEWAREVVMYLIEQDTA